MILPGFLARRLWAIALVCVVSSPMGAWAKSVALVIGNSAYSAQAPLPNPPRDARGVAGALRTLGFEVTELFDLDKARMTSSLSEFAFRASQARVAVIYYAGHGMEMNGANYLIPVDARLRHEIQLAYEGVNLEDAIRAASLASDLRLVLLDACRDNPFTPGMTRVDPTRSMNRGLARIESAGEVHVAYAAAAGAVAKDGPEGQYSPFAGALIETLRETPRPIDRLLGTVRDRVMAATGGQQRPQLSGPPLSQDVFLSALPRPAQPLAPSAGGAPAPAPGNVAARDLERAQAGSLEAMLRLGRSYARGLDGLSKNADEAIRWWRRAAELGDLRAMNNLGLIYGHVIQSEQPRSSDLDYAVEWLEDRPQKEHATLTYNFSLTHLNYRWYEGWRVGNMSVDNHDSIKGDEAVRWLRPAAEQGLPEAMFNLGSMYVYDGWGIRNAPAERLYGEDALEAVHWWRRAAEKGHVQAMGALGVAHAEGYGTPQDTAEAVRWWRRAAELGETDAMFYLGSSYEKGVGGLIQSDVEAARWYLKAANEGQHHAMTYLGALYAEGRGTPQDDNAAVSWWRRAAGALDPVAMKHLGFMYEHGRGVPLDPEEAELWYARAVMVEAAG